MTLKKHFLDKKPEFLEISRFRFIVGILLGLFYSFFFYSFLYLIREVFRVLSITENYDMWVLTDKEVNFYNLFFAFLSVVVAQAVCFTFWFDRPRKAFGKMNHIKSAIVHDQRALNWYFLSWFSRLAFLFGLWFGIADRGGFYKFSLFPEYKYIFVLVIIILFFQTWNKIIRTFRRRCLRWLLVSILAVSAVSFGLSRINLIDYKAINEVYLKKNIQYNYDLELPESEYYERLWRLSLVNKIYVVKAKNHENNSEPIIIADNEEVDFEKLHEKIKDWQSYRKEEDILRIKYNLHIDKGIKMKFINKLKNKLIDAGAKRISFAVIPSNPQYDKRYYFAVSYKYAIPVRYPKHDVELLKKEDSDKGNLKNIIEIKLQESGQYLVNEVLVELSDLKLRIKQFIKRDSNNIIKISVGGDSEFSDYIKILSCVKKGIAELRNEYAIKTFKKEYGDLNDYVAEQIRCRYPFRVFELSE